MAKSYGIDVSHWNKYNAILEHRPAFVMIKLTEGLTFIDNAFEAYVDQCDDMNIPYGFYHYARAEKNDARKEAEFFVSQIPAHAMPHCVLALDFEGKSLSITSVDAWAVLFLKRVEELTHKKPLLYCSQSVVKRFPMVAQSGYGLWVARYRNPILGAGSVKPWKFAAMWQYTSKPIDKNIFYGNIKQFKKYGEQKHV